jgi:ABC-type transport system substrate-binding protein
MDIVTISDIGLMTSRLKSGEFEAAITGLATGELASFLRAIGYNNASFYELLDESLLTFEPEKKDHLYRQLTAVFQTDIPVTVLHPFTAITIASKRIRGLDGSPYRGDLAWCMDDLWLEAEA